MKNFLLNACEACKIVLIAVFACGVSSSVLAQEKEPARSANLSASSSTSLGSTTTTSSSSPGPNTGPTTTLKAAPTTNSSAPNLNGSAGPVGSLTAHKVVRHGRPVWNLRLGYFTWQERVQLNQGAQSDQALANFFGNSLSLEHESFFSNHSGISEEIFLLAGTAAAGGTQSSLAYAPGVLTRWSGAAASLRYAYRMSDSIILSVGPIAMTNAITWPTDTSGTQAKSESHFFLGMVADVRYRLTQDWEVRQLVGSLSSNLGILWTLSLGYQF